MRRHLCGSIGFVATMLLLAVPVRATSAEEVSAAPAVKVLPVWPDQPPAWDAPTESERDTTGADGRPVAGKRVIRLGNVRRPEMHVYPATDASGKPSSTVIVVCPGGGFSILAWDLEGTEIAEQLQAGGVTAVVLKYRVPTREMDVNWKPPVQDIQRSVAMIRAGKVTAGTPGQVGVLGFSAGGHAAFRAATMRDRTYESVDATDRSISPPDFACLIYAAWLVEQDDPSQLVDGIEIDGQTPRMFFAHAENDRISVMNCVTPFTRLHAAGVPAALHVFTGSGHGFGSREDGRADDLWMTLCLRWLNDEGLRSAAPAE